MLTHVGFWILEAAFRSLLVAAAVWAAIRVLRVRAVLAQKVAWVLVLLAAGTMPLVMHAPWLALERTGYRALRIPIRTLPATTPAAAHPAAGLAAGGSRSPVIDSPEMGNLAYFAPIAKAAAAHSVTPSRIRSLRPSRGIEHTRIPFHPAPESVSTSLPHVSFAAPMSSPGKAGTGRGVDFWNWTRTKPMLAMLYLAVGGILVLRTLAGLGIAFRIWRRSLPIENFADGTLPTLGKHPLQARVSPDIATPVTIGSTVILPSDFPEWDTAKLRIVLAHEQSHVRQGDFYLQLLAALHVAIFWFSPLGWWLQCKLSELGEALSDRAGLEQAPNPSSYAQVLLEFAARPRTAPLAGVAMARRSNLSSRIERILNARLFRLAFLDGRRHAIFLATLVPAALVAVVACIRIVPAVEAAQGQTAPAIAGQVTGVIGPAHIASLITGQVNGAGPSSAVSGGITAVVSGQVSGEMPDQMTDVDSAQEPPPAPAVAPSAPHPPSPDVPPVPASAPEPEPAPEADLAPEPPKPAHRGFAYAHSDDDEDSFAIIRGNDGSTVNLHGHSGKDLDKAKQKYHGNFIWFEHDGKSYVITDPAIVAQSEGLFKGDQELNHRMSLLDQKQAELDKKMALLQPEMDKARLPGPEFEAQMKKLQVQLAELQSDKYKKLTDQLGKEFSEEKLGELQEKIGDIEGQIGEIQGQIGERQGLIGEKEGALGEQMGRLGEEMGRIGEQQGKIAEEAARKMKSVFDQAIRDGKAKPVD